MWSRYNLQLITVRQKQLLAKQDVREIIDYAIRTGNDRLKAGEFALYRKNLLDSDTVNMLFSFYAVDYPVEFANLYLTDPEMYYRLKAYFTEYENKPDSAHYYFRQAEMLVRYEPGKEAIYWSNFYNRYGEFLVRHGHKAEAIEKFKLAYKNSISVKTQFKYDYLLVASRNLERLYAELGDYRNAWHYASVKLRISDSISSDAKKDQVMAENVKQQQAKQEAESERDRQKIRQGKNESNMLAGGVVFFIIVSLLVLRN
jgi:hypothetical protein